MLSERGFTVAATAFALLAGFTAGALWWTALRAPGRTRRLALTGAGLATLAAAWLFGTVATAIAVPSLFGVIHLWYLLGVVTVPAAGAVLVLGAVTGPASRTGRRAGLLGAVLVLPAVVGIHATHIAPFRLAHTEVEATVPEARSGEATITVAVLADLQTAGVGEHERAAVDAIVGSDPDLVLVPGDVLQAPADEEPDLVPEVRELFEELAASAPTLVAPGNTDGAELAAILDGTGARLLHNETETLTLGDRTVTVAGLELDPDTAAARETIARMSDPADGSDIRILLSHVPDAALEVPPDSRIDLVVSGHTHGGQVTVPGFGPPMTLTEVPRDVAAGGLSELRGNQVLVSRGVGMERGYAPQMRIGVPPEIVLVELGGP